MTYAMIAIWITTELQCGRLGACPHHLVLCTECVVYVVFCSIDQVCSITTRALQYMRLMVIRAQ